MRKSFLILFLFFFCGGLCARGAVWPFNKKQKEKLNEARLLHSEQKYEEAVEKLKDFLVEGTVKRREKRAYLLMGDSYERLGKTDSALNTYIEGVELNPKNKDLLCRLANLYQENDLTQNAIETYLRILELDRGNETALLGLARAYMAEGFFSKAQEYYQKFFDGRPKNAAAYYYEYALSYYRQRNYNAALLHVGRSLEVFDNYENNFLAANITRDMGKLEEARIFLEKALEKSSSYEARATAAFWAAQDGEYGRALVLADAALKEDPLDNLFLYIKFLCYDKQGNKKEAAKHLRRITAQEREGFIRSVAEAKLSNYNI